MPQELVVNSNVYTLTDNQTAKRVQIVVGIGKKEELSRNKDEETDIEPNRYDNSGRVWENHW